MGWVRVILAHSKVVAFGAAAFVLAGATFLGSANSPLMGQLSASRSVSSVLYVSPHGSDSANACTQVFRPCQTIAHAVSVAPSGATILVEPGLYRVAIPGGIDLFQPVTIKAIGHVVLTGKGPIFDLYNTSSPMSGVHRVTIEGFHFQNVTGSGYNGVITVPGYGASDVTIADNTFSHITDEAIGYHGNNAAPFLIGSHWRIVGNTIDGVTHSSRSGIWLGNLSGSVIADNSISNVGHAGIILTATSTSPATNSNNQILNNRISDVPHEGIQVAFGNSVLVKGNVISRAGTYCMDASAASGCASSTGATSSAIMLNNPGQTNITVIDNSTSQSFNGLTVGPPTSSSTGGVLGTGVVVLHNSFVGDSNAGVANFARSSSAPLNAMLNWWGCPSGPNTGNCSSTLGSVDYTPWLTHAIRSTNAHGHRGPFGG
jgi:hypothetical protein